MYTSEKTIKNGWRSALFVMCRIQSVSQRDSPGRRLSSVSEGFLPWRFPPLIRGSSKSFSLRTEENNMKKIFLIFGVLFLTIACWVTFLSDNFLLAQDRDRSGGCCMQRDSTRDGLWYENGLGFRECEKLNRKLDDDDVFYKTGRVWWDVNC